MKSTYEILEDEIRKRGLAVVVNTFQQLCFTQAAELKSKIYYEVGMVLGKAVKIIEGY